MVLKELKRDPREVRGKLRWKPYYEVLLTEFPSSKTKDYCKMCERLHKEPTKKPSTIKDLRQLAQIAQYIT